jgi:hypothetical protein
MIDFLAVYIEQAPRRPIERTWRGGLRKMISKESFLLATRGWA